MRRISVPFHNPTETTPLPSVFLCLTIVLLCLHLRLVFLRFSILHLCFFLWVGDAFSLLQLCGVHIPKLLHLLFKLLFDFDIIWIGRTQG
jgi:hypothetical protein